MTDKIEMPKAGDYVFVYGTLRAGQPKDLSKAQSGFEYVCSDAINGLMYDLGYFPGVKHMVTLNGYRDTVPVVFGDIFRIENPDDIKPIDLYEGVPDFYSRKRAKTALGYDVWYYEYESTITGHQRVYGGDWVEYYDKISLTKTLVKDDDRPAEDPEDDIPYVDDVPFDVNPNAL